MSNLLLSVICHTTVKILVTEPSSQFAYLWRLFTTLYVLALPLLTTVVTVGIGKCICKIIILGSVCEVS